MAEMLVVIAGALNPDGQNWPQIQGVMDTLREGDNIADNAETQLANGIYRSCELLCPIAQELDKESQYTSEIEEVQNWMAGTDNSLANATEQIAFGSVSAAMYVGIIDTILDKNGQYSEYVNSKIQQVNSFRNDLSYTQVNGIYRMVDLLRVWGYCAGVK